MKQYKDCLFKETLSDLALQNVEEILAGNLSFKKLKGFNINKVNLTVVKRFLWTDVRLNGDLYMFPLNAYKDDLISQDFINHDYNALKKSLNSGRWAYIQKHIEILCRESSQETLLLGTEACVEFLDTHVEEESLPEDTHYPHIYFNNKFIAPNADQSQFLEQCVSKLQYRIPQILTGNAGSGKSCLLLEAVRKILAATPQDTTPIYVLTDTEALKRHHYANWHDTELFGTENNESRVRFLTYNELFCEKMAAKYKRLASRIPSFYIGQQNIPKIKLSQDFMKFIHQ